MRTKAHAVIQRRYVEQGETTRIVVLPLPGRGLPTELIDAGQPVTLDLLAGRPVNLELDEEGLAADLCFGGPPVRCRFPWDAVVAAQDASGQLVQTLVVTVATVMEDGSARPTLLGDVDAAAPQPEETGAVPPASPISVLDGGRTRPAAPDDRRPAFEVIPGLRATDSGRKS